MRDEQYCEVLIRAAQFSQPAADAARNLFRRQPKITIQLLEGMLVENPQESQTQPPRGRCLKGVTQIA